MAACASAPRPAIERIAVIPFDNQSGSRDLDWAGPAMAHILARSLAGSPGMHAFVAADTNEATRGRATQLLVGTVSGPSERLSLSAALRDSQGKTVRSISPPAGDPIAIVKHVAGALRSDPRDPGVRSNNALRLFGQAQTRSTPQEAAGLLTQAVSADPAFLDAQFALARIRGAPPSIPESAKLDPIDSARLRLALARSDADRVAAAEQLAGALPADPDPAGAAGSMLLRQRQYDRSAVWLRKAVSIDPESAENWNTLAYVQAYSGDLAGAAASIAEYGKRRPGGNASDSLGEIHFLHGKFAEAEKAFLEAYQKEPNLLAHATLRKAAVARRFSGDAAGADALFQRYLDAQSQHPLRELLSAQWDYACGRSKQAISRLEKFAVEKNASPAWSQLAVWRAIEGTGGAEDAKRAVASALAPQHRLAAAIAYFVTLPPASAPEWRARAEKTFGVQSAPLLRNSTVAYALLIGKHFSDAVPILEELWRAGPVIGWNEWTAPLAWALTESGKTGQARELLRYWPIPDTLGDSLFASWTYPRVQQLMKR